MKTRTATITAKNDYHKLTVKLKFQTHYPLTNEEMQRVISMAIQKHLANIYDLPYAEFVADDIRIESARTRKH